MGEFDGRTRCRGVDIALLRIPVPVYLERRDQRIINQSLPLPLRNQRQDARQKQRHVRLHHYSITHATNHMALATYRLGCPPKCCPIIPTHYLQKGATTGEGLCTLLSSSEGRPGLMLSYSVPVVYFQTSNRISMTRQHDGINLGLAP